MPAQLDVYKEWLGITEATRPLNYYALLRLPKFEDDAVKIRSHYRKMNAHVRKYAAGEFAQQSQELLNELAKSMLCLTDAKRKSEYDATLGRKESSDKRYSFEELLLRRKVIDQTQLDKARKFADTTGMEVRDALVQQKLVKQEIVMQVFAEAQGVPYVELADVTLQPDLLDRVPAVLARQHSCAPLMVDEGLLLLASPNLVSPEIEDQLRLRFNMPVRTVLCTPTAINAVIQQHYPKEKAAAEMAGGGSAASGKKADATPAAEGEAKAAKPAKTMSSAETKKQRNLIAFMGFNFTFMALMIYWTAIKVPYKSMFSALPPALVIGLVVAGIAWGGLKVAGR